MFVEFSCYFNRYLIKSARNFSACIFRLYFSYLNSIFFTSIVFFLLELYFLYLNCIFFTCIVFFLLVLCLFTCIVFFYLYRIQIQMEFIEIIFIYLQCIQIQLDVVSLYLLICIVLDVIQILFFLLVLYTHNITPFISKIERKTTSTKL